MVRFGQAVAPRGVALRPVRVGVMHDPVEHEAGVVRDPPQRTLVRAHQCIELQFLGHEVLAQQRFLRQFPSRRPKPATLVVPDDDLEETDRKLHVAADGIAVPEDGAAEDADAGGLSAFYQDTALEYPTL